MGTHVQCLAQFASEEGAETTQVKILIVILKEKRRKVTCQ